MHTYIKSLVKISETRINSHVLLLLYNLRKLETTFEQSWLSGKNCMIVKKEQRITITKIAGWYTELFWKKWKAFFFNNYWLYQLKTNFLGIFFVMLQETRGKVLMTNTYNFKDHEQTKKFPFTPDRGHPNPVRLYLTAKSPVLLHVSKIPF